MPSGNQTGPKTLPECQHEAVLLSEMLEGITLMDNEGDHFAGPRTAITMVAHEKANMLAEALDRIIPGSAK